MDFKDKTYWEVKKGSEERIAEVLTRLSQLILDRRAELINKTEVLVKSALELQKAEEEIKAAEQSGDVESLQTQWNHADAIALHIKTLTELIGTLGDEIYQLDQKIGRGTQVLHLEPKKSRDI